MADGQPSRPRADHPKDYLGRGWSYPVNVNKATGRVNLSEYEDDIQEALRIILSTRRGERVMRPDFGSSLHEYVFEPADLNTATLIKKATTDAISQWEPRVKDLRVEVSFPKGAQGGFVLDISYVVNATNSMYNMVYPFFLNEGI
ncbi:MAG: GPW/gp25 family protein [Coriobacteriales bacterium]|jgi:phage baseplate assembly protein W|nr:GPW/gp25 family protein [Coriobacteriales bacterium]